MSHEGVVKYDERGVMDGGTMGLPRKIDRDIWLKEVFPEWGTYLNYEIDTFEVKPGTGALWYFGAIEVSVRSGLLDRSLRRSQHVYALFIRWRL